MVLQKCIFVKFVLTICNDISMIFETRSCEAQNSIAYFLQSHKTKQKQRNCQTVLLSKKFVTFLLSPTSVFSSILAENLLVSFYHRKKHLSIKYQLQEYSYHLLTILTFQLIQHKHFSSCHFLQFTQAEIHQY